jgi:hypothetical protein
MSLFRIGLEDGGPSLGTRGPVMSLFRIGLDEGGPSTSDPGRFKVSGLASAKKTRVSNLVHIMGSVSSSGIVTWGQ